MMPNPTFRDVEQISAYLDGQLPQGDATRLEVRLKNEPQLRAVFTEMSQARALLRRLPARRAPRNFTLTPKMAGIKPPLPRTFPMFRFASVLATILFLFAYAANLSVPAMSALRAAAPAPAFGMGGGGGGGDNFATAQNAAPAAAPAQQLAAPAAEAAPTAQADLRTTAPVQATVSPDLAAAAPGAGAQAKVANDAPETLLPTPAQEPIQLPVSPFLLSGLLGLAVISGASAFMLRLLSERKWFAERALSPQKTGSRQIMVFILVILVLAALVLSMYWLSNTTFYAPVSVGAPTFGDKGPLVTGAEKGPAVTGADKGAAPVAGAQIFVLTPGMGYSFSAVDSVGLVTTIDFPQGVFKSDTTVSFTPGLTSGTTSLTSPTFFSFSLTAQDAAAQPEAPFTVNVEYSPVVPSIPDENKLALYWWSGSDWQDAAATCSPASSVEHLLDVHRLRVTVCKMGNFALVAP
jgi:anti-sigma factor RsiW